MTAMTVALSDGPPRLTIAVRDILKTVRELELSDRADDDSKKAKPEWNHHAEPDHPAAV